MTEMFVFRENKITRSVPLNAIVFFESSGHYATIHMNDGTTHSVRSTMYALVDRLPRKLFVRTHSGVIVNMEYITRIKYNEITLNSLRAKVSLSRAYRKNVKEAFYNFKNSP